MAKNQLDANFTKQLDVLSLTVSGSLNRKELTATRLGATSLIRSKEITVMKAISSKSHSRNMLRPPCLSVNAFCCCDPLRMKVG
eukprot:551161-Rhodomonas_salina.3